MLKFAHDLAGGQGNIIAESFQSPNFSLSPFQGWKMTRSGTLYAADIVLPDGTGVSVFFSATPPVTAHVGDLWYNIANGLELSRWSGSAWVPFQIGSGAIAPAGIQPSNIAALSSGLLGNLGVLNPNPYFIAGDSTGWAAYNAGGPGPDGTFSVVSGGSLPAGAPYAYAGLIAGTVDAFGVMAENGGTFPATTGHQYQLNAWVYSTSGSAVLGFQWADGSQDVDTYTVTANTWTQLSTVKTAAVPGAAFPFAGPLAGGSSLYAQALLVFPQVPGGLIQAGTVTAAQIAAGTITAGLIAANTITASQIAANTITAGQIAANSITEATLAAWAVDGVISQAAFHGLNMIPDPQFSNSGVSTARTSDPVTAGSWTLSGGQAQAVNSASAANILALMSSTAKPIWVNPGETYYYSVTVSRSGASVNQIGVQFLGSTTITKGTTAAGTNTLSGTFTIPAGWSQMYVRIFANTSATADTITWSSPVLQPATLFSPVITGGTFNGTNWIENSTGSFFYSGTPAANNLIQSESNTQGQDGSGNYFLSGNTSYVPQGGGYIAIQNSAGAINFWFAAAMVSASNPWTALGNIAPFNGSPNLLQIASGPNAGDYIGLAGPVKVTGGFHYSGPAVAYHPGGTTDETWQNITLDAGWTSVVTPQYRLLPDGLVAVRGQATHAGTTAATNINNSNPIPSAYWPTANRIYRPPVAGDSAGTVQISSTGVFAMRASGFTATQVFMDGIYSI